MKAVRNQKAKKIKDLAEIKKLVKKRPITKAEKSEFISNKFDEEEWTW